MNYTNGATYIQIGNLCFTTWRTRNHKKVLESEGFTHLFWRFYSAPKPIRRDILTDLRGINKLVLIDVTKLSERLSIPDELKVVSPVLYLTKNKVAYLLSDPTENPIKNITRMLPISSRADVRLVLMKRNMISLEVNFISLHLVQMSGFVINDEGYILKNRVGDDGKINERVNLDIIKLINQAYIKSEYAG